MQQKEGLGGGEGHEEPAVPPGPGPGPGADGRDLLLLEGFSVKCVTGPVLALALGPVWLQRVAR